MNLLSHKQHQFAEAVAKGGRIRTHIGASTVTEASSQQLRARAAGWQITRKCSEPFGSFAGTSGALTTSAIGRDPGLSV